MRENLSRLAPGARVRGADGLIGTVERLEYGSTGAEAGFPRAMIVRSDDEHWRYRIPTLLVRAVSIHPGAPQVVVDLPADQLTYYIVEGLNGNAHLQAEARPQRTNGPLSLDTDDDLRVPIAQEFLVARKSPVLQGRVHIRKEVGEHQAHFTVPVFHEEALVERIPADQYDGRPPADDEILIPVTEERLIVRKETVVREYLRVRKELVARHFEVRGTLRREMVDVTTQIPPESAPQLLMRLPDDEGATSQPALQ